MKIVFIGTSPFGLPALCWLSKEYKDVVVVTQPDRPVGRKQQLEPSPIKKYALKQGLVFYQPENINTKKSVEKLRSLKPDVAIVAAYGQILKQNVLDAPKLGCLNLHGSLLPKYRGASPVQASVLNDDKKTGVTIIKMDKGLDTGDMVAKKSLDVKPAEMATDLQDRLAELASELLRDSLKKYIAGEIDLTAQDDTKATYTKKITREDGRLMPSEMTVQEIVNRFRAFHPWPGIWLEDEKLGRIKILGTEKQVLLGSKSDQARNLDLTITSNLATDSKRSKLYLKCRNGFLEVKNLQRSGKPPISAKNFLVGVK